MSAPDQHRAYSPESVAVSVLTVSDSRTLDDDTSGQLIEEGLRAAGHKVASREIVPDEPDAIRAAVARSIETPEVDCVLISGGTGVAPRDSTVEAVTPLLRKVLPGFGELFRMLSFEEIGPAAMLSRAMAGTAGRTVIFLMPGSRGGVKTALERLILPELTHIVGQLRR